MWAGGSLAALRGRGAPFVSATGAFTFAAGMVWSGYAHPQAGFWLLWSAPLAELEAFREEAARAFRQEAQIGILVGLFAGLPALMWGFWQERWEGIGETVAAGTLVMLTLATGHPARDAVAEATSAWTERCDRALQLGPAGPSGDVVDSPVFGGVITPGGLWEEADDLYGAPDVPRTVGVAPGVSCADLAGVHERWEGELYFAGWSPEPYPRRIFDRHPVLQAARCRSRRVPQLDTRVLWQDCEPWTSGPEEEEEP